MTEDPKSGKIQQPQHRRPSPLAIHLANEIDSINAQAQVKFKVIDILSALEEIRYIITEKYVVDQNIGEK
jgi:hypothetical protein